MPRLSTTSGTSEQTRLAIEPEASNETYDQLRARGAGPSAHELGADANKPIDEAQEGAGPSSRLDPAAVPLAPLPAESRVGADIDQQQKAQDNMAYEEFKAACEKQFHPDTPMTFPLPKVGDGDHWKACHEILEKHDNYVCKGWNTDIDTLLVFAGLFSAAVTAFTIDSYKWLRGPDSGDTTVILLQHISRQLADPNITVIPLEEFHVPSSQRRINIFWFLSLVVALMTALLGILCKQWLREYQKDAALSYKDSVALRQMRFEAFTYWRVENFISALPLLLQLALLLFILGVLDLLWSLDHVVACVITVAAVLGFGFVSVSTILPGVILVQNMFSIRDDTTNIPLCAFKSPQAWLFIRALLLFCKDKSGLESWLATEKRVLRNLPSLLRHAHRAVLWLDDNFSQNESTLIHLANCIADLPPDGFSASERTSDVAFKSKDRSSELFVFLSRKGRHMMNFMRPDLRHHFVELMLRATKNNGLSVFCDVYGISANDLAVQQDYVRHCIEIFHAFQSSIVPGDVFISAMLTLLLDSKIFEIKPFFHLRSDSAGKDALDRWLNLTPLKDGHKARKWVDEFASQEFLSQRAGVWKYENLHLLPPCVEGLCSLVYSLRVCDIDSGSAWELSVLEKDLRGILEFLHTKEYFG